MKLIPHYQAGVSLIEVMISVVIGSMLMLGLVTTFTTSSDNYRELQKASDLIENGRYAMDVIYNDVRHAGFFGFYYDKGTFPASLPDPCETASEANLLSALIVPIQGYTNVTASTFTASTTCDDKGFFTAADLQPNTDVLVIRRADTDLFAGTDADGTSNPVTGVVSAANNNIGEVYIQSNSRTAEVQIGVAATVDPLDETTGKNAKNVAVTSTLTKMPGKALDTWADTRKLRVHIYYVAQCNAAAVCTAADTPTLKRLELGDDDAGNTVMNIVPLVEGIEYFKVQYGIDTSPASVDVTTGSVGDGIPDSYVTTPTTAQFENVVAIKTSVLARSLKTTNGYVDSKAYTVGPLAVAASGDQYKRNVYSTEVRPNNIAGRREIP
jgi:type IV pilus assembly protein PilW